ncbi:HSF-type DNA-binding-domain-containing protein, partial [Geranomyces variabilis]
MVQKTCFIQKLHTILESDQYSHLIRWSPAGTSFLVLDSAELSSQVLPTVFKHNNYTSFVRQLNLYGFHKKNRSYHRNNSNNANANANNSNATADADDKDTRQSQHEPREFSHPKFLRFRPDLLAEIRRKPTAAQQQQQQQ